MQAYDEHVGHDGRIVTASTGTAVRTEKTHLGLSPMLLLGLQHQTQPSAEWAEQGELPLRRVVRAHATDAVPGTALRARARVALPVAAAAARAR